MLTIARNSVNSKKMKVNLGIIKRFGSKECKNVFDFTSSIIGSTKSAIDSKKQHQNEETINWLFWFNWFSQKRCQNYNKENFSELGKIQLEIFFTEIASIVSEWFRSNSHTVCGVFSSCTVIEPKAWLIVESIFVFVCVSYSIVAKLFETINAGKTYLLLELFNTTFRM